MDYFHLVLRASLRGPLQARMKASATRAAASTPPAPHNPATKLADRSGVKACKPSNKNAAAMRIAPTTSGRGPSEADKQCDRKIPDEVIELPTEGRAGCPVFRTQGHNNKQHDDDRAKNFCCHPKTRFHISCSRRRKAFYGSSRYLNFGLSMAKTHPPLTKSRHIRPLSYGPPSVLNLKSYPKTYFFARQLGKYCCCCRITSALGRACLIARMASEGGNTTTSPSVMAASAKGPRITSHRNGSRLCCASQSFAS
jgi:hypothetical protein